jgi:ubiquinone/menaquinone biosynthesis C-methylase UbiE
MKRQTAWNRVAGIYDSFMARNIGAYREMYRLMAEDLRADMDVLELAIGTGLIALNIAESVCSVTATDFSPAMIAEAQKKTAPGNVTFASADATTLPYADRSFDAVIISNALHIMPEPEAALVQIRRVLKPEGILIAPNFSHKSGFKQAVLSRIMTLVGMRVHKRWTPESYLDFLRQNGFEVARSSVIPEIFAVAKLRGEI